MARNDTTTQSATANPFPIDLIGLGKKRLEKVMDAQKEIVSRLPALTREWTSCAEAERELTSDLLAKLTAARSIPESATVYQEWLSRRMEMFAEEARKLLADAHTFVDLSARLFAIDVPGSARSSDKPTSSRDSD